MQVQMHVRTTYMRDVHAQMKEPKNVMPLDASPRWTNAVTRPVPGRGHAVRPI